MSTTASQITSLTIVYSNIYSGADQRNHQSSSSLAFFGENSPVTPLPVFSPHKGPVTRKMFPFDDVIMHFMDVKRVPIFCEKCYDFVAVLQDRTGWNWLVLSCVNISE